MQQAGQKESRKDDIAEHDVAEEFHRVLFSYLSVRCDCKCKEKAQYEDEYAFCDLDDVIPGDR